MLVVTLTMGVREGVDDDGGEEEEDAPDSGDASADHERTERRVRVRQVEDMSEDNCRGQACLTI